MPVVILITGVLSVGVLTAATGDNCGDPIAVQLPAALPFTDVNTTCGRADDYNGTCLGVYDDGEDIVYALTLAQDLILRFEVAGAAYAGIAIDTVCSPGEQCLAQETDIASQAPTLDIALAAGSYTVMVDTWGGSGCTDFTLTIEELPPPATGDRCIDPLVVTLPADLPYSDVNQSTCGRGDFHRDYESCASGFTGGEEIVYELDVVETVDVEIVVDPRGLEGTAVVLDHTCPPAGAECIAWYGTLGTEPRVLECLRLEPGTYTLMVDSWPAPGCNPNFDLMISACQVPLGACCVESACIGAMPEPACLTEEGTWYGGFDCATFACPIAMPSPPESCAAAHVITEAPFSALLATYGAAPDGPPGSCNAPETTVMQNDVWFTYTPAQDCTLTVDVVCYYYRGVIALYSGTDCGNLIELHCRDAGWPTEPTIESASIEATGGETYWVQVGDWGVSAGGGTTLCALNCASALCRGDADCDGDVDFLDIVYFVAGLSGEATWTQYHYAHGGGPPTCSYLSCDVNAMDGVNFEDIVPFVNAIGRPCQ